MENNKKPDRQIVILMGESGAGKTTYLQDHAKEFEGHNIVSRDMVAHEICILKEKETGNHYFINDVYRNIEKDVLEQKTREKFAKAVNNGDNIVVEAASLNSKLRTEIVSFVKKSDKFNYKTKAIIFHSPSEEEHLNRLFNRSLKRNCLSAMNNIALQDPKQPEPIKDGEFDHIEYVGVKSEKTLFHEYQKPASLADAIKDAKTLGNTGCYNR